MMTVRPASARGHANHGWLDTHHSFSFADYYDPKHMGFRALRVLNEDRVAPGRGFGAHPHRDMEIISYVLEGALQHRDSMGNGSTIVPGDVQRMSAGTGVRHSEYNGSPDEPVHFLQIWLQPNRLGIAPSYEQKRYAPEDLSGRLRVIASPDGRDDSVTVHTDAVVYATRLAAGERVTHTLGPARYAWIYLARGSATVDGQALGTGDAAAVWDTTALELTGGDDAEVLLFDLA